MRSAQVNCDGPVGTTGRRMCFYLDVAQRSFGFHMSVNPRTVTGSSLLVSVGSVGSVFI